MTARIHEAIEAFLKLAGALIRENRPHPTNQQPGDASHAHLVPHSSQTDQGVVRRVADVPVLVLFHDSQELLVDPRIVSQRLQLAEDEGGLLANVRAGWQILPGSGAVVEGFQAQLERSAARA